MASIQNVRLKITELPPRAVADVSYEVIGSAEDVEDQLRYIEIVELIGVDPRPGEDGIDDPIPNARSVELLTFPLPAPRPAKRFQLRTSDLDEDRPGAPFPVQDEIQARVTLRPVRFPAEGESNVVTRGGLVNTPLVAEPA